MRAADILHVGLGAAFMAKDRVETLLKDLEGRGEISRDEAKKFLQDAQDRARLEQEAFDERVKEKVKQAIEELGLATKKDIEELKSLLVKG